jgi:putative spermidine/putrescine transport system permease protein
VAGVTDVPSLPTLPPAVDDEYPTAPTALAPQSVGRPSTRFSRIVPITVVVLCALFFLAPLLTLARHSLQNVPAFLLGRETLFKRWALSPVTLAFKDDAFWPALKLSLKLALGTVVLTLALLLPTAVWTHLRVPKARSLIEFVTVLPYMIPPIAMVAGIIIVKPHARWFLNSDFSLIPFYVVLALPFTYRSIDAGLRSIDLRTLVDASRNLGAGWGATLWKVLIPNLRAAIISAAFLTAAVVIGEFTIADTLLKETLPRFQATFVGREPQAGYALNLLALLVTTLLFVLLSVLTKKRDVSRKPYVPPADEPAPSTSTGALL